VYVAISRRWPAVASAEFMPPPGNFRYDRSLMRPEEEQQRVVDIEKFLLLTRTLPTSIGFGLVLTLVAAAFLYSSQPPGLLALWVVLQFSLSYWRLRVVRSFRLVANTHTLAGSRQVDWIRLGCLVSGLLWGSMALCRFPVSEPQIALFVAFLLAGVTAGGTTAMAADTIAALLFEMSVLMQLALRLLVFSDEKAYYSMGLTTLLYAAFMVAWTRRLNQGIVDSIHAQLDARTREAHLQQREARYRELAHHDALTGLPNRLSLQSQMPQLFENAAAAGSKVAIVYIDLDHFKDINDSRGHRCGDRLLAATAERLRECVRPSDLVVRMGGDEFIVAAFDTHSHEQVGALVERLSWSINAPLRYEGDSIEASASMGIAIYPDHGDDIDVLMRHADIALYAAKAGGRRTHQFFTPAMSASFTERIFLQQALGRALGTQQLFLEYQPLVDLRSGQLIGFEALLRWRHPERGMVPPLVFIPVAEHTGLIDTLGAEVAQMVCRQLDRWRRDGLDLVPVAINVSPRHFERGSLGQQLAAAARAAGVEPSLLHLEITETALMNGTGQEAQTLEALKALGVKVMIDDFGIGYSSLNHLKSLAIDGLKIDRSFVRDMTTDERDAAIVSAVIGIARSLGLGVLAEGVESLQHVQQLRALGCDQGQGNYLHPPVSADKCATLLAERALGQPVHSAAPRLQVV
jgi:diguanylate cyclase (GGDEF)-like protein